MNIIKFVPGIAGKTRECNALIGQNVDQSNSISPHVHIFKKLEPINKETFSVYPMANQTTPESEKTVSRNIDEVPSLGLDGPTPKTDKKALVDQQRLVCQ